MNGSEVLVGTEKLSPCRLVASSEVSIVCKK